MRFIRGHNSVGMDRSGPRKTHYIEEDRGYTTPCWTWQLGKTSPNARSDGGYAKITVGGKSLGAHRYYYEQAKGPIPQGLQLDHLCRNRDCVNPDHLEPVTPLENVRRGRSSKLSLEDARDIERRTRADRSSRNMMTVALEYGVSYGTVLLIRRNGADAPRIQRKRAA